jgi:hypothetical protein
MDTLGGTALSSPPTSIAQLTKEGAANGGTDQSHDIECVQPDRR